MVFHTFVTQQPSNSCTVEWKAGSEDSNGRIEVKVGEGMNEWRFQ